MTSEGANQKVPRRVELSSEQKIISNTMSVIPNNDGEAHLAEEIKKSENLILGHNWKTITTKFLEEMKAVQYQGDVVILSSREDDNNSIAYDKIIFDNLERVPQILDLR